MQEIDGKKYYTWDEIRAMKLGTKFRCNVFLGSYFYLDRNERGDINIYGENGKDVRRETIGVFMLQDRLELYEEPKEERAYMYGWEALEKLYNGDCGLIHCDNKKWKKYISGLELDDDGCIIEPSRLSVNWALGSEFMIQKKWYVE